MYDLAGGFLNPPWSLLAVIFLVGVFALTLSRVHSVNQLHLFFVEVEIKEIDIVDDSLRISGFGNRQTVTL